MKSSKFLDQVFRFFFPKRKSSNEVRPVIKSEEDLVVIRENISYPLILESKEESCTVSISESQSFFGGLLEKTLELELQSVVNSDVLILSNSIVKTKQKQYELDLLICKNGKYYNIEIDEPYSLSNNGKLIPIHYIGKGDRERDFELYGKGISVIRFAEEQIAREQDYCVALILDTLDKKKVKFENEIPLWSYEDCQALIKQRHRNSYLPFELKIIDRNVKDRSEKRILQLIIRVVIVYETDRQVKVKLNFTNKIVKTTILAMDEFYDLLLSNEAFSKYSWLQVQKEKIPLLVRAVSLRMSYNNLKFIGYGRINGDFFNIEKKDISNSKIIFTDDFFRNLP